MPDSQKLENFLEVPISDEDTFILTTHDEAASWLASYKEEWEWVFQYTKTQPVQATAQPIQHFINELTNRLQQLTNPNANTEQLRSQILNLFKSQINKGWILSNNPKIKFALQSRAQSDLTALMRIAYFQGSPYQLNLLTPELFDALMDAMIFDRKLAEITPSTKATITKAITGYEADLSKLRTQRDKHDADWTTQLTAIQATLKEHSDNLQNLHDTRLEKLDNFIAESEEKIEAWKKAHREEINLKEPVTFWEKRKKTSLISWIVLGLVFVASLCATGAILVAQSNSIYEGLKLGDKIEYWRVAAMLLLGGLAFWFLRIISKIFLSQLHAWSDAQERVTMVQTYLSLLQDEKGLGDNDRRLILEALFRPSPSGIIKDDGVPPAMFDMISRLK
ncbi:DUF6161 domain-containing protein [Rubritalea tangerina]|uniref:DUF6161 domain-containing protein n=1 Tax=Rubritalea tangerina TaxID=430798 RepID=A0ABW4ZCY7_9BACT